jgi:hypothetical protein
MESAAELFEGQLNAMTKVKVLEGRSMRMPTSEQERYSSKAISNKTYLSDATGMTNRRRMTSPASMSPNRGGM